MQNDVSLLGKTSAVDHRNRNTCILLGKTKRQLRYFGFVGLNPWSTELRNLNFQSLEVVFRYRDPQLQVTENLCYLRNLNPNIYQCFKIESIFYF